MRDSYDSREECVLCHSLGRAGYIEIILWGPTEAKHLWHKLEKKHFSGPLGLQQSELSQISLRKRKGLGGGVSK